MEYSSYILGESGSLLAPLTDAHQQMRCRVSGSKIAALVNCPDAYRNSSNWDEPWTGDSFPAKMGRLREPVIQTWLATAGATDWFPSGKVGPSACIRVSGAPLPLPEFSATNDGLARHCDSGVVIPVEIKTHWSAKRDATGPRLSHYAQMLLEMWLWGTAWAGKPSPCCIYARCWKNSLANPEELEAWVVYWNASDFNALLSTAANNLHGEAEVWDRDPGRLRID